MLQLILPTAPVLAQTVYLTNASPGVPVELLVNAETRAMATADAGGIATLRADPPLVGETLEALIWVDVCGESRRVLIVDRSAVAPEAGACVRTQVEGVYRIGNTSSVVIDLGGQPPVVRLRQGPVPPAWLAGPDAAATVAMRIVPNGLILFGGGGTTTFRDFIAQACGNVGDCDGSERRGSATAGLTYWVQSWLGLHATYRRLWPIRAEGRGEGYVFNSELDGGLLSLGVQGGVPVGRFRIFGNASAQYHRATLSSEETIDDRVVTIGGIEQTVPGGTHTAQAKVGGFGAMFGVGLEMWLNQRFGIYGEYGRLWLHADDLDDAPIAVDDSVGHVTIGGRMRLLGF